MHERFHQRLTDYNNYIKEDFALEEDAYEAREKLASRIGSSMRAASENRSTPLNTQYEIFGLQQKKQELMEELRAGLRSIDEQPPSRERVPPGARRVIQRDGVLLWSRVDGTEIPLTMGDILTDIRWDITYHLDTATVPRLARRKYLIEQTRHKIESLLDDQIATEESTSEKNHPLLQKAYRGSKESKLEQERMPFGLLAERILVQLAKKWIIDGEIPFRVRPTDLHQDVTQKIDFVIERIEDSHQRGVEIKQTHNLHAKAIQFTLQTDPDILAHKQQQIDKTKQHLRRRDRIDDVLLVTVRSEPLREAYRDWQRRGKPPGGPAGLLTEASQREIFTQLTIGMISQEEIDSYWERAA